MSMGTPCRTVDEVVVDGADVVGVIPYQNVGEGMVDGAGIDGKDIVAKVIVEAPRQNEHS